MFSSSLKGPTSHDQMNMNQNKFRYCTSLAYHTKIHYNAGNNIYLNQNFLGVDLQLCLCFTECNQCCPSPVGRPYQRVWAPQTTRMQGTTWVQRQMNSNSLIFEPPTCVAACATKCWSPRQNLTPRFFEKLAALQPLYFSVLTGQHCTHWPWLYSTPLTSLPIQVRAQV